MKNVKLLCLSFLLLTSIFTQGQVNYSEHIAPIIYENCTSCHRAGEVGPQSFTNYEEVSNWAGMIQYVTENKIMPPWQPNPNYSHFVNERTLTNDQIQMIQDWVNAGLPQGDPNLEPPIPDFPTGSQIGVPDVVLQMEESHTVIGNNQDDYQVFVLPTGFTEDKEIAAIEFRPDNRRAVHHVLYAYDMTGQAAAMDAATPEYGYYSFGDFGVDEAVYLTWSYVPGNAPLVYPEGIGEIIPAGADLLIQVHYAPLPTDETDQSSVNIFFKDADDPIEREVRSATVWPFNLPGGWNSFQIPPNEVKTFVAESLYEDDGWFPGIDYDISVISVDPHAHYLGKSYEVFVVTPDNDTLNLLEIPDWDFNWQGSYSYPKMLKIPANSEWFTVATYDNTVNNPNQPANPPINVSWGEGTEDEMLLVSFYYVPYQAGDEDIVIGGGLTPINEVYSPTESKLFPPNPNPSNGSFSIPFSLKNSENLQFDLYTIDGQLVKKLSNWSEWKSGEHLLEVTDLDISAGTYFIKMSGEDYVLSQKVIILK